MSAEPQWCEIHQHSKWCGHNGGVRMADGWRAPGEAPRDPDLEPWRQAALDMAYETDGELHDLWIAIVDVLSRAVEGDPRVAESVPALCNFIDALAPGDR